MSPEQPLLAARGAGRRFGQTTALEPVELELRDYESLALVGPNGAGKSTLLALLAGALEPSVGRIERRKGVRVGWAPQRPAQYGRLSARENLELFARLEGDARPQRTAERLLGEFELPDGGAVVFVTQNLEELDLHADRVVAMQQGRLVPAGVEEVYS